MIVNFADQATEDIYNGNSTKAARKFPQTIWAATIRKLDMLEAATQIGDLSVPPNNRLEKLAGHLDGFYSIRVNDQFRIVFRFNGGHASDVKLIDYH